MIRSVSLVLLGLSVCVTSGCAAVGAGRPELTSRLPWQTKAAKADTNTSREPAVSFRPPDRLSDSKPDDATDRQVPGHLARDTWPAASSLPKVHPDWVQDGSQIEQADWSTADNSRSGVVDAQFRSDRDSDDNPIQLQGLQIVDAEPRLQPAGEGMPSPGPASPWQSDLERLIARAERELAAMPKDGDPEVRAEYRRQQVHLRLLYLMANHPEQALMAIPSLDRSDTEYWQQMLWAMADSLHDNTHLSAGERSAQTIPHLNTAMRQLREQADLNIRNCAFCEEISYFGNYKRFPTNEFVPGQPVLLYAEIENFRSELSPTTSEYRTMLKSLIEIVGENGQIRWKKSFPGTEDLCRNPRRDYFHNYQFTIPERLPLGQHVLRLTVVDELSGKQATSVIKFVVK